MSNKDNYHVPLIEQILQIVSNIEMFSLLDRFLDYNQVLVTKCDQLNTTFHIKWGIFWLPQDAIQINKCQGNFPMFYRYIIYSINQSERYGLSR
jgi:hypothetical protein